MSILFNLSVWVEMDPSVFFYLLRQVLTATDQNFNWLWVTVNTRKQLGNILSEYIVKSVW